MDDLLQLQRRYEDALETLEKESVLCAQYESTFRNLEALTKSMLAKSYYGFQTNKATQKEREMFALASDVYLNHLSALATARDKFMNHRALKEVAIAKCDFCRTQISTERAKIGLR